MPTRKFCQGYEIRYKRRNYRKKIFTWVEARKTPVYCTDEWINLGDPWDCPFPKHQEIHKTACQVLFKENI